VERRADALLGHQLVPWSPFISLFDMFWEQ
jgi:hypothetical protein